MLAPKVCGERLKLIAPETLGTCSDHDPLDLVEVDLVAATIVEAGGPRALVVRHGLGDLELAAVLEVLGDASRAERVIADTCRNASGEGPSADHAVGVRLAHGALGELLPAAPRRRPEEVTLRVNVQASAVKVRVQVGL